MKDKIITIFAWTVGVIFCWPVLIAEKINPTPKGLGHAVGLAMAGCFVIMTMIYLIIGAVLIL